MAGRDLEDGEAGRGPASVATGVLLIRNGATEAIRKCKEEYTDPTSRRQYEGVINKA